MSSTKMRSRLPGGGPYVSFVRFSTFASRFRCTSSDVVRDEKLMFNTTCRRVVMVKYKYLYHKNMKESSILRGNKSGVIMNKNNVNVSGNEQT